MSLLAVNHVPATARAVINHVPATMRAAVIRRERYGSPRDAFQTEAVPVPVVGSRQLLVKVMAAGVNYNGIWAAAGAPVDLITWRRRHGAAEDYHVAGSDASGVVWAAGPGVRNVRVGDEVVLSCGQYPSLCADECWPSTAESEIWGYETNHGAFAEFTLVYDYQCHPKPAALSWEEASCFMLTGATAYHLLHGWQPHVVRPDDVVLIWGGAGGLGSAAIQLVRHAGGIPVAVVSSEDRADYCRRLGAAVVNRVGFTHWGALPDRKDKAGWDKWMSEARRFGTAIWDAVGRRRSPRIVLEHPGSESLPTSLYVCDRDGMVVTCGATSGYVSTIDLRVLWMRQKRIQGSHFAGVPECRSLLELVSNGTVMPCLSRIFPFEEVGEAHQLIHDNQHPPGNIAIRIGAA
jgi:crotonyl-CoA carboxylase/reductase